MNEDLFQAYTLKDMLKQLWTYTYKASASKFLDMLVSQVWQRQQLLWNSAFQRKNCGSYISGIGSHLPSAKSTVRSHTDLHCRNQPETA